MRYFHFSFVMMHPAAVFRISFAHLGMTGNGLVDTFGNHVPQHSVSSLCHVALALMVVGLIHVRDKPYEGTELVCGAEA